MPTEEQLIGALRQADAAGDTQGAQRFAQLIKEQRASQQPVEQPKPSRKDSFLSKLGRGMADPSVAAAQLVGKGLTAAGVGYGKEITDTYKQMENQYQANRVANGDTGTDWARIAGNIASPTNLAIASKIPMAGSLGQKVIDSMAAGELAGTLTPAYDENFAKQKAGQIALGGIVGGAIQPVASGIGRIISPKASQSADLALLKSEGVQPTVGQALGGNFAGMEEKFQSLPWAGGAISESRRRAAGELQDAAFNRALKPVGEKLPAGLKGNDAVAYTQDLLSKRYTNVLDKIGAITPDEQFNAKALELSDMVNKIKMPEAEKQKFAMALDDVMSSVDENGVMTSEAYKSLESSLGSQAKTLGSSTNVYEQKMAPAVSQLRQNLSEMLNRQAGSLSGELKQTNKAWANFKRVQKAAGSGGADSGEFSPAQLQSAVRALDKSKDKGAFAAKRALMQDLSSAGKSVLGNKVPDSGTAGREAAIGLIKEGVGILTAVPSYAMYSKPVQNALVAAVTKRPELAPQIAERLNALATPATAGFIPNRMGNE